MGKDESGPKPNFGAEGEPVQYSYYLGEGIGGKHIEAKRAAAPPVRKGFDISGTDLLIIIRNIFIHSYNFLQVLNSFMIPAL